MEDYLDAPIPEADAAFEKKYYAAAFATWLKAAETGNREAQYQIGQLYAHGHGVVIDLPDALAWLRRVLD
jgi:TPR repeat protein